MALYQSLTNSLYAGESGGGITASSTDTLTNKTITDSSNDVAANSLNSATTNIDVSSATAPSAGQVLTATSSTAATWQTPSSGGGGHGDIGAGGYFVNNSGSNLNNNITTAGNNLLFYKLDVSGNVANGGAVASAGTTWRNITGIAVPNTNVGFFTRIS